MIGAYSPTVHMGAWQPPRNCYVIYRGQDGNIDYDSPIAIMALDDAQVSIPDQALAANTIWNYVRRQAAGCGLESDDSPICEVLIDSIGDMLASAPNPPQSLSIEKLAGAKFKLRWRYTRIDEQVTPTGFNIYIDSGSGFDFATLDATISFGLGGSEFQWTSGALTHGNQYRFCVRSYRTGEGESQNTDYVAAIADSEGPEAITGLQTDWEEI